MIQTKYTVCLLIERKSEEQEDGGRFPGGNKFVFENVKLPHDPLSLPKIKLGGPRYSAPIQEFDNEKEAEDFIKSKLTTTSDKVFTILKTYKFVDTQQTNKARPSWPGLVCLRCKHPIIY